MSDGLHLATDGLFSKWGFNDGDEPEALLDLCDERGLPYPDDWHTTLRHLVTTHMLPTLSRKVTTYDIETIHNPIRALTVDGVEVSDEVIYGRADAPCVEPATVTVPWDVVLRACGLEVVENDAIPHYE